MTVEQTLRARCDAKCELCAAENTLAPVAVAPSDGSAEQSVLLCETCRSQLDASQDLDVNHWRCLNDSMWTPVAAVQVMAWRQLSSLSQAGETWAQELLDMLYLEEDVKQWAEATQTAEPDDDTPPTLDSNGTQLQAGDSVYLIKDLVVKGANFTAKRGTAVRNISLTSNPEHIEGRVNGTRIVLLSCYLKKS